MSTQFHTNSHLKKIVYLSVLISIGVVLNLIEPPQLFLPGAKLGLANLSTVLSILLFNGFYGVLVALLRTVIAQIFRGQFIWISFGTSFFGGVSAALVMAVVYHLFKKKISIVGVSALGGIVNNIAQVLFVFAVTRNAVFLYYLFFLIPIGGVSGFIIGVLSQAVYNRLNKV